MSSLNCKAELKNHVDAIRFILTSVHNNVSLAEIELSKWKCKNDKVKHLLIYLNRLKQMQQKYEAKQREWEQILEHESRLRAKEEELLDRLEVMTKTLSPLIALADDHRT